MYVIVIYQISLLSHRYVCCCYLPDPTVITSVCMLWLFTRSHCYHTDMYVMVIYLISLLSHRYVTVLGYLPDLTVITPVCMLWSFTRSHCYHTGMSVMVIYPISLLSHRYVCYSYLPDLTVITPVCMLFSLLIYVLPDDQSLVITPYRYVCYEIYLHLPDLTVITSVCMLWLFTRSHCYHTGMYVIRSRCYMSYPIITGVISV